MKLEALGEFCRKFNVLRIQCTVEESSTPVTLEFIEHKEQPVSEPLVSATQPAVGSEKRGADGLTVAQQLELYGNNLDAE